MQNCCMTVKFIAVLILDRIHIVVHLRRLAVCICIYRMAQKSKSVHNAYLSNSDAKYLKNKANLGKIR